MLTDVRAWIRHGRELLHASVKQLLSKNKINHHEIYTEVGLLLDQGVNVHALNSDGATPLHVVARSPWPGSVGVATRLIEHGANIEALNKHGATTLHNACRDGSHQMVTFLINKGAELDALTNEGDTPLHQAVRTNKAGNVRTLILAGASRQIPNDHGQQTQVMRCSPATREAYQDAVEEYNHGLTGLSHLTVDGGVTGSRG